MREVLVLLVAMGLLALPGCMSGEYIHAHKKPEQLTADYNRCDREVMENQMGRMVPLNTHQQNLAIDQCLRRAGWYKKDEL